MTIEDDLALLADAAGRLSNWGRWGPEDQAGTLNYITAEHVLAASRLIQTGEVISLALPFDVNGPQTGHLGRFNPMHFMTRDGDDTYARDDFFGLPQGIGGADDVLLMPTAAATHWDSLAHMFYDGVMWNGYDCREVTSSGAERNDITSYRDRLVGRAVLLDLPRYFGLEWCEPGHSISAADLLGAARDQQVALGRGDILLLRFGAITHCRRRGDWSGYAGGDAPGLAFDTLDWVHRSEVAAIASDTWGVEVRPNVTPHINQPWHRIALPKLGLAVGEMFDLDELARRCAADGRWEMFFAANPCPITGSVNGPINPTVVR